MSELAPTSRRAIARLREIGPHPALLVAELAHRHVRRRDRRRLRGGYTTIVASPPGGAELRVPTIELPAREALPEDLHPAAERLRHEADEALAGRIDLLGSGPTAVGPDIDWHRDFRSGHRWPEVFYADVPVVCLDDASDPKVPWELSRCHHLVTLARGARVFGEPRYALEVERQLAAWLTSNPPGVGINWTCSMEVALRAINWVHTVAVLGRVFPLPSRLRAELVRSLQVHARHIAANLEGSPSLRGNHYLADMIGLAVLGCVVSSDPEAPRWRSLASRALEREARSQVHEDGAGFEASLPYHGLALELLLTARAAVEGAGFSLGPDFDERLRRMAACSAAVRHPSGRIPQFGDSDSGRVLPAGSERPPTHDPLLWLAAAQLGERQLDGTPHEEVAWTLGLGAWLHAATVPHATEPSSSFPQGGWFALKGAGVHCAVRCGGVGQNGRGGHAHNDLLSFELSHGGTPLVVDSGTYAYTGDLAARDEFRATAAHSTLRLDGQEQRPLPEREPFRLSEAARILVEIGPPGESVGTLVGSHDGYRRLGHGTVHTRTFCLGRASGVLELRDEVAGTGEHFVESFVRLAPGTCVRGDAAGLELESGSAHARLVLEGFDRVQVTDGWVSDRYGVRERAPVVIASAQRQMPARFALHVDPSMARVDRPRLLAESRR